MNSFSLATFIGIYRTTAVTVCVSSDCFDFDV